MKNLNAICKHGKLLDKATGLPIRFMEGRTYAILADDDAFEKEKAYSVEEIRLKNPNAYAKWSNEDDDRLEQLYCQGSSVGELTKLLGRNRGAIESRIKKLELKDKYPR
jgi:hypothetical protein